MSDAQKLKNCIAKQIKGRKALNDELNKIEEDSRAARKDKEEQSNHQS